MTGKITIDLIIDHLEKEKVWIGNAALAYDSNTAGYLKYSELAEIYKEAAKIVRCEQKRREQKGAGREPLHSFDDIAREYSTPLSNE